MIGYEAHPSWLHFGKRASIAPSVRRVRVSLALLGAVIVTLLAAGTPLPMRAAPSSAASMDQARSGAVVTQPT